MIKLNSSFRFTAIVAIALTTLSISACRESEQGRVLMYKQGVYQGKKDTALKADVLAALHRRASLQATGSGLTFSGGGDRSSTAAGSKLRSRARLQTGN